MKMMLSSFVLPQTWQLSTGTLPIVPNALLVFFFLVGMAAKLAVSCAARGGNLLPVPYGRNCRRTPLSSSALAHLQEIAATRCDHVEANHLSESRRCGSLSHMRSVLPVVVAAEYAGDFRVRLRFNDATERVVDCKPWLVGPVFEPLRDEAYFKRFFVDGGTLNWPNGADIAPETLYEAARS